MILSYKPQIGEIFDQNGSQFLVQFIANGKQYELLLPVSHLIELIEEPNEWVKHDGDLLNWTRPTLEEV